VGSGTPIRYRWSRVRFGTAGSLTKSRSAMRARKAHLLGGCPSRRRGRLNWRCWPWIVLYQPPVVYGLQGASALATTLLPEHPTLGASRSTIAQSKLSGSCGERFSWVCSGGSVGEFVISRLGVQLSSPAPGKERGTSYHSEYLCVYVWGEMWATCRLRTNQYGQNV